MNEPIEPFLKQNEDVRYTFYVIMIVSYDEDNATFGTQELVSKLTGYAINEWIFHSYLIYYNKVLRYAKVNMTKYENITYDKFLEELKKDFGIEMNDDNYIDMATIELIGETVFYNGLLAESMREYHADFNDIDDVFFPAIFQMYDLINGTYRDYFTEEFRSVKRLLDKVCNIYIPIAKLIDSADYCEGTWFLTLPDNVKINMTKLANFSKPIESIGWYDIVEVGYQLYYYINNICDYTGSPEDG